MSIPLARDGISRSSTTQQSASSSLAGRFIWHDLISDDIARSKQLYGALFGWKFEKVERLNGRPYALIKHQGTYLGGIT